MSTAPLPTPAAPPGPVHASLILAGDIKLAHSIFALPFALLGMFMAAWPPPPGIDQPTSALIRDLFLVVVAMIAARTAAMLANRWLDRDIDKQNPRTSSRALAAGRVPAGTALIGLAGATAVFLITCAVFGLIGHNWWPLALSIPVLGWLCLYPLMKRFTWTCHLWLGASLAMSPLAAALAISPPALVNQPTLWIIAIMVLCWVAGFDVIYALQDLEIDQREGLHSIPSRFGSSGALWLSRLMHLVAAIALLLVWWTDPRLGAVFLAAVILACLLLVIEQLTVKRWGTSRLALTFFTLNGFVACIIGGAGIIDLAWS